MTTISVLIPAYRASSTIVEALESVLSQTVKPLEIIILLDGDDEDARRVLAPYRTRIILKSKGNAGVGEARNDLVNMSKGDVAAFLDADDIWHPLYLEYQLMALDSYPEAVASFTGHNRFTGAHKGWWGDRSEYKSAHLIAPSEFLARYNTTTAVFGSMSYTCIRRSALRAMGDKPFGNFRAAEDSFMCYGLALLGPVAFVPKTLVSYRISPDSLSEDRVRNLGLWVNGFELLRDKYLKRPDMVRVFYYYFACKRREYAKILLLVGRVKEARAQLIASLERASVPSIIKSAVIYLRSYGPSFLYPNARVVRT